MIERLADDHRQCPAAGRGPGRAGRNRIRRGHRPAGAGSPRPGAGPHELRAVQGPRRPGRVPRRPQGSRGPDGRVSPRRGPRRDPPRRQGGGHRRRSCRRRVTSCASMAGRIGHAGGRPKLNLDAFPLSRPAPAPDAGPLDATFYDLVEANFRRSIIAHPDAATFLGIHTEDHRLPDGTREAVEEQVGQARAAARDDRGDRSCGALGRGSLRAGHRAAQPAPRAVRPRGARIWERRSTAIDGIGDPLFGLFARDFAPLDGAPRLDHQPAGGDPPIPGRAPESGDGAAGPAVAGARARIGGRDARLLRRAGRRRRPACPRPSSAAWPPRPSKPRSAVADYEASCAARWPRRSTAGRSAASATTSSSSRRAFDGLDADRILEIGYEQLDLQRSRAHGGRPRDRSGRRRGDGDRPPEARPSGHLRRGARRHIARRCSGRGAT